MSATLARLVRQVRRRVDPASDAGDSALLALWVDQADENAFELLLWRHGPMVWQTCRRVLRHDQDAEDAFQASFLALARKASSIRTSTSVAGWLYRVALRAALAARSRPQKVETIADLNEVASARPEDHELRARLDEEIGRLPERYREAFVLCCLQGLTTDEAAAALNCPRGTVGTRVAWARRKLRERLGQDVPSLLPAAGVPAVLIESAMKTVTEGAAPPVAELCREVMTMLFVSKMKGMLTWLTPLLVVAVGLGGLSVTGARADKTTAVDKKKPADEAKPKSDKKPAEEKPKSDKKPADENKPGKADVQGAIKSVANDGKLLTIVTKPKDKNSDEETIEVKLTDKTQVLFFGVGTGETTVNQGQGVAIWLEEKSKDTAAKAHVHGQKHGKGAKPALTGPISSVANDGKTITIVVKPKNKNEDAVEQTIKLTDKTEVSFVFVEAGGAKLTKDMAAAVWLSDGSTDTAARVTLGGKADLPNVKKNGEAPAHQGVVAAVDKDGKSVTITEYSKNKNEEPKKLELKLSDKSRNVFGNVGLDGAKIQVGQQAAIWVDSNARDTVSVALFQAPAVAKPGLAGKVTAVADDGKSFTLLTPPTKKNEEGKEVTIKLGDKTQVIFNGVAPGAAKITKGYAARVELTDNSKDTAAVVTFGQAK
jgi:RNA polymerase sigma factor (sigma-70 family)